MFSNSLSLAAGSIILAMNNGTQIKNYFKCVSKLITRSSLLYKFVIKDQFELHIRILQKKKEFVDTFFSLNDKISESSEKKQLIEAIKLDKIKIIENSFLKEKLEKFIGYMKSQESAAVNYQFDFNSKLR